MQKKVRFVMSAKTPTLVALLQLINKNELVYNKGNTWNKRVKNQVEILKAIGFLNKNRTLCAVTVILLKQPSAELKEAIETQLKLYSKQQCLKHGVGEEQTGQGELFDLLSVLAPDMYKMLKSTCENFLRYGYILSSSEVHVEDNGMRGYLLKYRTRLEKREMLFRLNGKGSDWWFNAFVTPRGFAELKREMGLRANKLIALRGGLSLNDGSRFQNMVKNADDMKDITKPGANNIKLGARVRKGSSRNTDWKVGLEIRTISLEEGVTCPLDEGGCILGRKYCYMGYLERAIRIKYEGRKTADAIASDILSRKPMMYRIHVSGDFPDEYYVRTIFDAIVRSGSSSFGYTHHQVGTVMGDLIRSLALKNWDKFAIRTSFWDGRQKGVGEMGAVVIDHDMNKVKQHNAVWCPEQNPSKTTKTCADCALCWNKSFKNKNIAFCLH